MGVSNAWAYNEYNKQYLYFDGSEFTSFFSDNCTPYISPKWDYNCSDGNSNGGDKQMTSITSKKYYYLDLSKSSSSYKSFRGFYIGRSASFYNGASMGVVDGSTSNCIKATGWGTYKWTNFAPPMSSASIENKSTVYGGDGTSNNPYQIKKGATISVQASATSSVPNDPQTKYYKFYKKENSGARSAIGNESTTTTSSFTASSTVGTKYEVDVEARNEYYGTYGEEAPSSTLYFITIEPIYAILGSFNDWTHSANTWDLSDQGSDNWKATFHLEQGNHTFKVVHNSNYYGKNSITITRSSATASSLSTSGDNINLTADYAGNYTFTFNSSTKNLTVTYPTIYKVTYSHVPDAAAEAPTTNPSVTSGNSVVAGTSVTFTAKDAKTGYTWKGWYDNNAGTGTALSTNKAYTRSITANTTIYAVYTANTYTVTLNPQSGTGGTTSVTATYGAAMPEITKPTRTGYTFNGYYDAVSGGTQYYKADGSSASTWNKTAATTLYARWAENKHSVTVSYKFGAQTIKNNTTHNVGEVTATNISASPISGYTFSSWTLGSGLQSGNSNQSTISITTKSSGDYTLTANYTEDLTSDFVIRGGSIFGNTWDNNNNTMTKKTGSSGQNIVYYSLKINSLNVENTNSNFYFKVYNTSTNKWYGLTADDRYWYNRSTGEQTLIENGGKDIELRSDLVGTYEIKVDYTVANSPKITINYPEEIYLKGDFNEWGNTHSLMSGSVTVNLKAGDHTFKIHRLDKNRDYWCSNDGTMTRANCSDWDMSDFVNTDCKITADIDGDYTFTYDRTFGKLTVHYPLTITLGKSKFGPYGIKYNGKSYFSHKDKDVIVNVPYGATINFIEGQPYSDIYTGGIMQSAPEGDKKRQVKLNQPFTVLNNVTFDDNYVTKVDQVAYLGVPNNNCDWDKTTTAANANFTWRFDSYGSFSMTNSNDRATYAFEANGVKYYKFTIPAGCNEFQIQRKQARDDDNNNQNHTFSHTCDHEYMVLNTGINCYMLDNGTFGENTHTGHWCELPPAEGDFRVLYVEQQVANGEGNDSWKTVFDTTYQHASDVIRKRTATGTDIVSLHIDYDETKHPRIILQQMSSGKWVDVEGQARMAVGPLTATADKAMAPGRRNAAGEGLLTYDDGIEKIKQDKRDNGYEGRVWNFTVQQTVDNKNVTAKLLLENLEPYSGDYYIRTDNAVGGWICYNQPKNVMSYSEYSLTHSGYSHYFCKWVDITKHPKNVKFVVANNFGTSISDTIVADTYTNENGDLEANANVRWMWNEYTNEGSRAYIAGSSGSSASNFLVAKYAASSTKTFADKGEWVYEADLTDVQINDKLTSIAATYDTQVQELLEKSHADAGGLVMLASAGNDARVSSYTVRIVYDFKINQTICYLIPTGTAVATSIDVIIERINQDEAGQATQVTAAITPANAEGLTVYGLITLTQDHITDPNKSEQETLTYWISFPFDVKIGDITGFGEVGKHWMIKYYDGAERAAKGWFLDTKTFWKFFLDTEDVMKANTGYVLTLNKSLLNESNPVYDNTKILKLYFPSKEKIKGEINSNLTETSVTLEPLKCNITTPADRTIKDSHWNLIGVPSYAHKTNNKSVKFFYDYDFKKDAYSTEMNAGPETFHAMHAYMVQFAGTIDWSTFTTTPAQLAAKKNADAEEQYTLRLELQQNGTKADQTFVELHDDATTMFDMNVDLTKMFNTGANIYTLIGSETEVAANVMPIANTVIPVGVQIAKAGEYTFAMPDGTEGIVVELIDYETNTTTNLMLDEYTVNLAAGTNESRFALSVKPDKTTTSLEDININSNGVKKYLIDGVLYLQKDGLLYDAQGKLVR